jgi:hypothetical protein
VFDVMPAKYGVLRASNLRLEREGRHEHVRGTRVEHKQLGKERSCHSDQQSDDRIDERLPR